MRILYLEEWNLQTEKTKDRNAYILQKFLKNKKQIQA